MKKCYDDKMETSEVQAERIRRQRNRGDSTAALQSSPSAGEYDEEQDNGPADCLVTEMLQCLPTETVYEVTHWFRETVQMGLSSP